MSKSNALDPYRWFFGPESSPFGSPLRVPVIRILDRAEIEPDLIPQILREINDRQFGVIVQILVEAKFKAESMLRNEEVMNQHGKVAFFQGWVAYADYVIGSIEGLRQRTGEAAEKPKPGPEGL